MLEAVAVKKLYLFSVPAGGGKEGAGATLKMRLSGTGPGVSRVLAVERDGRDTPTQ